jgi:transketolase
MNGIEHTMAVAASIRVLTAEQTLRSGGGYLSQACSSAEILATLFTRVLRLGPSVGPSMPDPFVGVPGHAPSNPSGGRYLGTRTSQTDRFVLSPAHYAVALYATLISVGRLSPKALEQFNQDGSVVEMIGADHSPGCELATGSFGQALSQAAGIALARRAREDSGQVWVFMSDGEFQEGQTWEALQFLAFHRLDNVAVVVDVNGQQVDGRMVDVMEVEPLADKVKAFGAHISRVDAHDPAALAAAAGQRMAGMPMVILADSDPTRGLPSLQSRRPRLHYVRLASDQEREHLRRDVAQLRTVAMAVGAQG